MDPNVDEKYRSLSKVVKQLLSVIIGLVVFIFFLLGFMVYFTPDINIELFSKKTEPAVTPANTTPPKSTSASTEQYWIAPDINSIDGNPEKENILYGKELIAHTAEYFGPGGKVKLNATNGLNCQNCHLDAGTRIFGNNYGSVASTYPRYRARSASVENVYKRVNDCFERSLNGQALDTASKEMTAIVAYINWLGKDVPKGELAAGSGLKPIDFLDRAADPDKGKIAYEQKCVTCHMADGSGMLNNEHTAYTYPPLWGPHSYNSGAGLYRLYAFARYAKSNMPLGATHENPILTDEEAWDIAAYVNSQPRPTKNTKSDWPKIEEKPFDHPFGPYADQFDEKQHKYGPFKPIADARKKK